MEKLIENLKARIGELESKKPGVYKLHDAALEELYSVYPFNKFEYVISHLIAENIISLNQYLMMRAAYLQRNKYLYVFEITAPRTFGETWAQRHLVEVVPELEYPSPIKDPTYEGQYDLTYNGIKIEVKASRAVKRKSGETLIMKALSSDSKSGFDMNFQQIKPACCDVFVWIAVWRDVIRYWVLSSNDVANNKYFSRGQHRGNVGEGQLWIKESNIDEFKKYEVGVRDILSAIEKKAMK
jgi:hypothetical protein